MLTWRRISAQDKAIGGGGRTGSIYAAPGSKAASSRRLWQIVSPMPSVILEKAGVNISLVHGTLPSAAMKQMRADHTTIPLPENQDGDLRRSERLRRDILWRSARWRQMHAQVHRHTRPPTNCRRNLRLCPIHRPCVPPFLPPHPVQTPCHSLYRSPPPPIRWIQTGHRPRHQRPNDPRGEDRKHPHEPPRVREVGVHVWFNARRDEKRWTDLHSKWHRTQVFNYPRAYEAEMKHHVLLLKPLNMYKKFRKLSYVDAVKSMYRGMAARHCARFRSSCTSSAICLLEVICTSAKKGKQRSARVSWPVTGDGYEVG